MPNNDTTNTITFLKAYNVIPNLTLNRCFVSRVDPGTGYVDYRGLCTGSISTIAFTVWGRNWAGTTQGTWQACGYITIDQEGA